MSKGGASKKFYGRSPWYVIVKREYCSRSIEVFLKLAPRIFLKAQLVRIVQDSHREFFPPPLPLSDEERSVLSATTSLERFLLERLSKYESSVPEQNAS